MERNPRYNKRPKAVVDHEVALMRIDARPNALPEYAFQGTLGNLWINAATIPEVKRIARADLEICVEDVLVNRRRDDERVRAILRPLIAFIIDEYRAERLFLDIPLAHMHKSDITYLGAKVYGFDGGPSQPEYRERLYLIFQVEAAGDEEDDDGASCRQKTLDFEVPKELANVFTTEAAERWLREHNVALACHRLKRSETAIDSLYKQQERWNAVERRNS